MGVLLLVLYVLRGVSVGMLLRLDVGVHGLDVGLGGVGGLVGVGQGVVAVGGVLRVGGGDGGDCGGGGVRGTRGHHLVVDGGHVSNTSPLKQVGAAPCRPEE